MAIEKKIIMGMAPWIFDFFGGPGNKLKKKAIAPHCTMRDRTFFFRLGRGPPEINYGPRKKKWAL